MTRVSIAKKRVLLLGATGTIGAATLRELVKIGHDVVCVLRPDSPGVCAVAGPGKVTERHADVTRKGALAADGFQGEAFDAVISCMASRTGMAREAWAVDHDAHVLALRAAKSAGVAHFVLLSAICVQQPKLEFQKAKLAFEARLRESGLRYSIVRPTAFFKSLSGQVARVKAGKPFLVFGDGALTACKPISDRDLGAFIAGCLSAPDRWDRILPIGGPGPAITPRVQAEILFGLLGRTPEIRHVPVGMMNAIIAALSVAGVLSSRMRDKAELAQIGHFYGTHSMLVWDGESGVYSADDTPETGQDRLEDFYERLLAGDIQVDLGDHAVF